MRSLLTMLGIIIGVAAVISLTSLGKGLSNLIDGEINAIGSNLFYVSNSAPNGFPSLTPEDRARLSDEEAILQSAGVATIPSAVKSDYAGTLTAVAAITDNYFALTGSTEMAMVHSCLMRERHRWYLVFLWRTIYSQKGARWAKW
ncbi:MAG: ABC transporter permease [Anaerolineae bacterium]|nr:ABC transporter permease [Anaerolineae bacterium]